MAWSNKMKDYKMEKNINHLIVEKSYLVLCIFIQASEPLDISYSQLELELILVTTRILILWHQYYILFTSVSLIFNRGCYI